LKNLKIKLEKLADNVPILIPVFIIFWVLGYSQRDIILTSLSIAFLSILFSVYLDDYKSKRKVRAFKPAILLELRCILISLIKNFAELYMVYFESLKFLDFRRLFKLIERRRKDFPDYLVNSIEMSVLLHKNFSFHEFYEVGEKLDQTSEKLEFEKPNQERIKIIEELMKKNPIKEKFMEEYMEYIKERVEQNPLLKEMLNSFEKYKEIKVNINPIHMALISSILNNLSAFDKNFAEDIFYIWCEINELNKEIEVLKGLSQTDPSLILSISQRIERIAIKIDEILEKEGTNL